MPGSRGAPVLCFWRIAFDLHQSMSLVTFTLLLSLLWAVIYIAENHWRKRAGRSILPSSHGDRRGTLRNVDVSLKQLHLRLKSTGWNAKHDTLASRLRTRLPGLKLFLEHFYDVGSLLSILGMIVALGLLVWTAVFLFREGLWPPESTTPRLLKRGGKERDDIMQSSSSSILKPIVSQFSYDVTRINNMTMPCRSLE